MKTVYLKDKVNTDSDLTEMIKCAFDDAKDFRSKEADKHIARIKRYDEENRGLLHLRVPPKEHRKVNNVSYSTTTTDAPDGFPDCNGMIVHMDNISLIVESFKAVFGDALVNISKPHDVFPTEKPGTSGIKSEEEITSMVKDMVLDQVLPFSQEAGGVLPAEQIIEDMLADRDGGYDFIRNVRDDVLDVIRAHRGEIAKESADAIDENMTDQIQESNYVETVRELGHGFAKNDWMVLKAPQYVFDYRDVIDENGVQEKAGKFLYLEIVDPVNYYAAPNTTIYDNGSYEFDVSEITFSELSDSIDLEGFVPSAIKKVQEFFADCDLEWLDDDWNHEGKTDHWMPYDRIKVLKGRIKAYGEDLIKHGLVDEKGVKDDKTTYEFHFWKIHEWIIYGNAILNRKTPSLYKVGGWQRTGNHVYQSKGITTICMPYQEQIDKSYTHLIKNQEFSALGIWGYDAQKIKADDFDPARDFKGGVLIPVKPRASDGGNDRPIFNIDISSNVNEILTVVSHYQSEMFKAVQIDPLSVGITSAVGSNLRTTGLGALFQGNANKQILAKIREMESRYFLPFSKDLAKIVIWTSNDPRIKTGGIDVQVTSFSDAIRQAQDAESTASFFSLLVDMMNAISGMENAGVNVSGLKKIVGQFAEARGFPAGELFGEDATLDQVSGVAQQTINQQPPIQDGRVQPNIDTSLLP